MPKTVALTNIETALKLYLEKVELENKDIKQLFGVKNFSTIKRLKEPVLELMRERGVPTFSPSAVNTECAFEAWNLDVQKLERNLKKMTALGLREKPGG